VYAPPVKAEIANLATTRKAQTEAKQAHPAGKQAPAKALAEEAPAKQPAKKAAPVPAGSKLRWTIDGERSAKGAVAQHAETSDGTYKIVASGEKWKATYTSGGETTVLGDGVGHTRAYQLAVAHHLRPADPTGRHAESAHP
jgi:hypothetical protein